MILKESWVFVTDNTNVNWVKTFHLYQGFKKNNARVGSFIKASAKSVEPPRLEYKGFKYKYSVKGDICKLMFTRANYKQLYRNRSSVSLVTNSGFILKKKQEPRSKFLNGPLTRTLKRKKVLTLFKYIIY